MNDDFTRKGEKGFGEESKQRKSGQRRIVIVTWEIFVVEV